MKKNQKKVLKEISDSDLEIVEALLAKKYSRSRGKYKGKFL